jgi:hypothetical protein
VTPADYRSDKMESREGRALARERRLQWDHSIPRDVRRALPRGSSQDTVEQLLGPEAATQFWKDVSTEAKERSELMGFWLSWHLAGGFESLEGAGWNRATLFRKIRRFREVFGEHPDEYQFSWVRLDLKKAWSHQLDARLAGDDPDPAVR